MNRCLCGLAVKHHFQNGRKLDCWQAAARHQRASIRRMTFVERLKKIVRDNPREVGRG